MDDRPITSTGMPAVSRFSRPSSIFSSAFIFGACPLIPFTRPDVFSTPFMRTEDCFDFFPGGCFPLLFPGTERVPLIIRAAKGLFSSSSSSSLLLPSSLLKEDEDIRRFFDGRSLDIEVSGDTGTLGGF